MSSPPALGPVDKQEEGQPRQLDLPPPIPSASSSPSKTALPLPSSSTTIWPFSDPNLIFYLDSTPKAESLKRNLERRALAAGLVFRTTDDATQASHVILDSSSNDNLALRSLPRPVSLEWLKDSFFEEKGLPEEEYKLSALPVEATSTQEEGGEDVDEQSEFVSRVPPSRGKAWRHEEEADMARFLASDPLEQGQNLGSIWVSYQKSHPCRTAVAYREHHRGRKKAFFNFKVAELKAANNGQPIVYEHPEVEESSHDEEAPSFVPFVETRSVPDRSQPLPSYVPAAPEPKPLVKGKCSNCDVVQAVSFSRIKGKGDKMFCGGCYMAAYMANRKTAGTGDRALAARRRKVLAHQAKGRSSSSDLSSLEGSSEESSTSDASQIADPGPSRRPPHPSSSRTRKSVRKSSTAAPYTEQEDLDMVRLLARWTGPRFLMWENFSEEHPQRSPESARKRYQLQRERMDRKIDALRRKEGKKTRLLAASESEALEDDDSIGDDEHSDEDSKPLQPSASRHSSNRASFDSKRPPDPAAGSSKRMRFDSSNAVASSSKLPSSSSLPHHHRHSLPASSSHSHPYQSTHHPQPRSSLPSSSQQPVASNLPTSSQTNNRHSTSSSYPRPPPAPPLAPPRPPPPPSHQASSSSSSEEDLEPPSFLELGTKPTGCSPSSPWCFFCGCDKDGSDTFNEIALAGKNPNTGEIQKVRARLACDVCESSWEKRFLKGKKLGMGVAEMGELERLAWVTEMLIEKGLKVRERRVKGWNWDGGRSR